MPEPFKNFFNPKLIRMMAKHLCTQWSEFEGDLFIATAEENLDGLELKERSRQITEALIQHLPKDFTKAGDIILASVGETGISGWGIMPMTHYVGLLGHDHFDLSMRLLKEMTQYFSSEFDIRYFLLNSQNKTLSMLKIWATDTNYHVRRLVSEGSRPRLPWAMKLPQFIKDPAPVIELLEMLKDDEEEYVRRSVANNLNDIAKDHPDLVSEIASRWIKGAGRERKRLIRHACRTLIKKGHKKTLQILGYKSPKIHEINLEILTPEVVFGKNLEFELSFISSEKHNQAIIIDYTIHHQKANGKTSPKVFKWRATILQSKDTLKSVKKHAFKKISTRVYYPGIHRLEIMVNGVSVTTANFLLLIP